MTTLHVVRTLGCAQRASVVPVLGEGERERKREINAAVH